MRCVGKQATEEEQAAGGTGGESGEGTGTAAGGVPNSGLTNAMFSNLLQGVMQEVASVMSGRQSSSTVAHFLRNIPDFTYTPGEAFIFDLFMNMVRT